MVVGGTSYEFQSVVSETEGLMHNSIMYCVTCPPRASGVVYNMVPLLNSSGLASGFCSLPICLSLAHTAAHCSLLMRTHLLPSWSCLDKETAM